MHTCVGLELPSTVLRYRTLLNECEGCESGLESVNFDETTIESQILQLLEQTAVELGQNLKLYDRLNELSGTGSLDQTTSCADLAPPAPPPVVEASLPDPPCTSTAGFPAFPANKPSATSPPITGTTSSISPPTMAKPTASGRLAGPIGPNLHQPLRRPTVPKTLTTKFSKPYSNLHQTNDQSPKLAASQVKEKTLPSTPKSPVPAPLPAEPIVMPSLPVESSESEAPPETRSFGFRANVAYFQQRDQGAREPTQGKPPLQTVIETDVGEHPYEATPLPSKEVERPPTKVLEAEATRSFTLPSPNETTEFFKKVEASRRNAGEFQQPQKVETDSDDRARADSDENVSTTFTDLRLDNNEVPDRQNSNGQMYASLTDITGVQRSSSDQGVKAVEVQLPKNSEIRVPVAVEPVNLDDGEKERSELVSSRILAGKKMPKSSHKKTRPTTVQPGRPSERKFSSVFESGNERVHMSSATSPFEEKLFSPEESIDISLDYPEPKGPTSRLSAFSDSSADALIATYPPKAVPQPHHHHHHQRSQPIYLVAESNHTASRGQPAKFTIVMKPSGSEGKRHPPRARSSSSSSSNSSSSSSSSSSTSGRGRTRNGRSTSSSKSSSSSSSPSSSSSSPNGRKMGARQSPAALIRIEPLIFETIPKKKVMKNVARKKKNPTGGQGHCHHQHHSHHRDFNRQKHHMPPIEQIVVENCEPEFETCPHVESGKIPNPTDCQSSVVLRHVCMKCQRNLDRGKAVVRRNSIGGNVSQKCRSQSKHKTPTAGSPIQRPHSRSQSKARSRISKSPTAVAIHHGPKYTDDDTSSSEGGQYHLGDGEIFANRAFMKCYQLHHRSNSCNRNKSVPVFTVRSISDLRRGLR
ncbi:hypothetical protein TcWFU_010510 [Taenia crassiceps]|uniref:Uncharacterized protein n=1 Tax=Taenia crassiceps TaxID=6207 RepID=A0ABR4QFA0_9CEST